MTDDLVAWLRAQLDDDERGAREAARGERGDWFRGDRTPHSGTDVWDLNVRSDAPDRGFYKLADSLDPEVVEHIARHDPARVLAEVDAKRRILELHPHLRFATLPDEWPPHWKADVKQAFPGTEQPYVGCEQDDFNSDYEVVEPGWWCETVRLLALPYADRPGYRDEWRP